MKSAVVLGLVFIVVGVASLAYQGFTYSTRETVLDIGPLHATADRERTVSIPPGIVAVAGGIVLVVAGRRQRA